MKCNHCGALVPDAARFCDHCGGRLTPAAVPPAPTAPPRPPTPWSGPPPAAPARAAPQPPRPEPLRPPQPVDRSTAPPPAEKPERALPFALPSVPRTTPADPPPQRQAPAAGWSPPLIAATAPVPEVPGPANVTLVLDGNRGSYALAARERTIIGREDVEQGIFPDLDLTLNGAEEAGVSRRHAAISYRDGAYWLEDLDSTNYTWLNGQRLDPRKPIPVQNGDQIELGNLRMWFYVS